MTDIFENLSYVEHYEECQKLFPSYDKSIKGRACDLGLHINPIENEKFNNLVSSLSLDVQDSFQDDKFLHSLDIRETNYSINIQNCTAFPQVLQIIDCIYDQISVGIFKSHFDVNRVALYKTRHSNEKLENTWRWHYDDNSKPHIKLFIYLTDVASDTAPFTFLSKTDGTGIKMESSRISPFLKKATHFSNSRITDEFIAKRTEEGFKSAYVTGPVGTHFIFDPNIIHKGTVPAEGKDRVALVYHMHPVSKKPKEFYRFRDEDVKKYKLL